MNKFVETHMLKSIFAQTDPFVNKHWQNATCDRAACVADERSSLSKGDNNLWLRHSSSFTDLVASMQLLWALISSSIIMSANVAFDFRIFVSSYCRDTIMAGMVVLGELFRFE
jgi:hypothetical protein